VKTNNRSIQRGHLPMRPIECSQVSEAQTRRRELGGMKRGRRLTNRWSGRVKDKVPSPNIGVRAAQLKR